MSSRPSSCRLTLSVYVPIPIPVNLDKQSITHCTTSTGGATDRIEGGVCSSGGGVVSVRVPGAVSAECMVRVTHSSSSYSMLLRAAVLPEAVANQKQLDQNSDR